MPYLLDADAAIQAINGRRQTVNLLSHLLAQRIAISLISVGEIYEGAFRSPNPQAHLARFREFLLAFRVLPLNDPIMEQFAEIRADLRRQGQLIPDFDILLAATAIHHDLTLLTYNVRHLRRITRLKIYQPG